MNWLIFYDKATLQIEQYVSSSSIMPPPASLPSYNPVKHSMVELIDPPFKISRDHKAVLEDGEVVGTVPSLNPFQPDLATEGINWKQEWQEAQPKGTDAKVDLIARRLGLI